MKRLAAALAFGLAAGASSLSYAAGGGIPELNYTATCKATPPVAMDQKQTYDSCINDEKAAKKELPAEWSRSKGEWKESCLRQTQLGGIPSYVELITCLEMHDPSPPSMKAIGASNAKAMGKPDGSGPSPSAAPEVGSPAQRGTAPR